jgi:hypothetical protein
VSLEVQIQELEVQAAINRQEEKKEEERLRIEEEERLRGTQFTCFTGTKVPPLPCTCFTGTNVQILRQHGGGGAASRYSVYLLYWYTSTNFDEEGAQFTCFTGTKVLVQKYKF